MKKFILTALLAIIFIGSLTIQAQNEIQVTNKFISMSQGEQPAYIVEIPEANYESSLKNWKKLIRQNTKNKIEESGHEIVMKSTLIEDIYSKPINLYSAIIIGDSSLKLIAVYEIDSVFFDFEKVEKSVVNEKINSQIKHFMYNFASQQYMYAVEDELEAEENKLKYLQKELASLGKQSENNMKDNSENEQNIKNSQDAINSYEIDNERKQNEINAKKEAISGISNDPELLDQAKGQLKSLEKEKKGIEGKLEKEQKNIIKYQANIESLNIELERILELQGTKKEEIDAQELVVENVRKKLHAIK